MGNRVATRDSPRGFRPAADPSPSPRQGHPVYRVALTLVGEETRRWQPMSREQFGELVRGQRLQDRQGQLWTIIAEPREEGGLAHVVMRSGDLVRRVNERYADDYMLVEDG